MGKLRYTVTQLSTTDLSEVKTLQQNDNNLIESFQINSLFNSSKHTQDLYVYSVDGTLVDTYTNFNSYSELLNSAGAGKQGASNLTLDPIEDAKKVGFENGDIRLLYKFNSDLFSDSKKHTVFFIQSISPDRTELRCASLELTDEKLSIGISDIKQKLNSNSYFSEFYLNFDDGTEAIGINIEEELVEGKRLLTVKLYEPLPGEQTVKSTLHITEKISDSLLYEISSEFVESKLDTTYLKGPNFSIELTEENNNPTEYFNFNELFSFPVTSSYYELRSLFNEKSAQIAINHTDYSDFIHFSSAEERLRNFKYKLDLVNSYQSSIDSINSTGYTKTGVTGSVDYYENLIKGVIDNFDHYDRYLFYESSSYAWPKSNSTRPYINQISSTSESITWYTNQLVTASNYDVSNFDILINTIPTFIREDSNNEPYLMFIHMIAQHFDNLWIYFKAVSDKYDADNRLNFGVSKDIVRDALQSFGVDLYNSNTTLENLFSYFTGETYQSGSERIDQIITATSGSGSDHLQPVSIDNYTKEIYKRIYHNLPLLLKSKGTERGLRALINSFGIPSSVLPVKIYGGIDQTSTKYTGLNYVTSSLDKIRLDNTGSLVSGSTLSRYTSINKPGKLYSDDLHTVEIGFDISERLNEYFTKYLPNSFNIDNYIGDPRDAYEYNYALLDSIRTSQYETDPEPSIWENVATDWQNANWIWNEDEVFRTPGAFIRLVKFFDNSIFRVIKDFIPARSSINTGVVVKPDILTRNKIKQVEVSYTRPEYTSSISVGSITGSHGETFGSSIKPRYNTNYSSSYKTPLGVITRNVTDQHPRYTGEFSGSAVVVSSVDLNKSNIFKSVNQPILEFDVTIFNLSLPVPPACNINLVSSYQGEYYVFYGETGQGTVGVTYPTTVAASDASITYINNHNIYEYVTVEATPNYGFTFDGWYTGASGGGDLISTGSVLTLTYPYQRASGSNYYANFV